MAYWEEMFGKDAWYGLNAYRSLSDPAFDLTTEEVETLKRLRLSHAELAGRPVAAESVPLPQVAALGSGAPQDAQSLASLFDELCRLDPSQTSRLIDSLNYSVPVPRAVLRAWPGTSAERQFIVASVGDLVSAALIVVTKHNNLLWHHLPERSHWSSRSVERAWRIYRWYLTPENSGQNRHQVTLSGIGKLDWVGSGQYQLTAGELKFHVEVGFEYWLDKALSDPYQARVVRFTGELDSTSSDGRTIWLWSFEKNE